MIRRSNSILKVFANSSISSDYNCSPKPYNLKNEKLILPSIDTVIVDSVASGVYLIPAVTCTVINTGSHPIRDMLHLFNLL